MHISPSARFRGPALVLVFGISLLRAAPAVAQSYASATTEQGTLIVGRLPADAAFQFDGSFGRVRVEPAKLSSIMFSAGKATLTMRDGSVLNGDLGAAPVKMTWAGGDIELEIAKLGRIDFETAEEYKRRWPNWDMLGAPDVTPEAQVSLEGGGFVMGNLIEPGELEVECDLGKVKIPAYRLREVDRRSNPALIKTSGGSSLHGKISAATWKVKTGAGDLSIDPSKIAMARLAVKADLPRAESPPAKPPVTPEKPVVPEKPPGPPKADIWPDDWKPGPELSLQGPVCGRPALSEDGSRLFCFDTATSSVVIVETATMTAVRRIDISAQAADFSVAPGEKTAFLSKAGNVWVADLVEGRVSRKFEVEVPLAGILALSDDVAIGFADPLVVLSASRQGIVRKLARGGAPAHYIPSRRVLHTGSWRFTLPQRFSRAEDIVATPEGTNIGVPEGWSTSDGRFLVTPAGTCFRIGRMASVGFAATPDLPAEITASADFPGAGRWFLFRRKDVAEVALPGLSLVRYRPMPAVVAMALADERAGAIYVFAGRAEDMKPTPGTVGRLAGPGRWIRVAVGGK